ncbi:MAG: hypothetical protein ACFFAS_06430 [Promethearchaeota archaeon]
MTESHLAKKDGTLQFYNVDKVYFPNACVACGTNTSQRFQKSIIGNFSYLKNEKKDYFITLPLCEECKKNTKIKKSKEIYKIILLTIIGAVLLGLAYFFTYSFLIGIAAISLLFVVPFFHYRAKVRNKIELEDFITFRSISPSKDSAEDILELRFSSDYYANYMTKINLDLNKELEFKETISPPIKNKQVSNSSSINKQTPPISQEKDVFFQPAVKNGEPVDRMPSTLDNSRISCPFCKASNLSNSVFCISCGKRI